METIGQKDKCTQWILSIATEEFQKDDEKGKIEWHAGKNLDMRRLTGDADKEGVEIEFIEKAQKISHKFFQIKNDEKSKVKRRIDE